MIKSIKLLLADKYKDIGKTIKALIVRDLPIDKDYNEVYFSAEDVFKLIDEVINDEVKKLN